MTDAAKKSLKFIKLIDKFKLIERQIHVTDGQRFENDAEHSWHVALMAWVFASEFEQKLNIEKCLKMALIHDLVEIYTGDVSSFDHQGRIGKYEREKKASQKLFGILPQKLKTEMVDLWEEFEAKKSPEAIFTQAMDKMQPPIQNILSQGKSWQMFKITEEMVRTHKMHYNRDSKFLTDLIETLLKQSRKYTFKP